ncbi:uncharacterized protein Z518_06511 [Rhinocladiella mackenziei CBS 650.93]|uniref:1-alkyl-2-acetylglycerophosphocholine esterase n=1 Tax=Rhinocladiella mackenziei CBS 650.93 TaxID=1442369 RepID=A0A0D2II70_9EURO|nr:uncharacterized protein Z518_06511 [Rhinocladiella mackenziei CBS 650.93]KIX02961.1 hypothetical protein Z518_06511 [Rhinocladiella mackenziei CBS 650.93]
MQAHDAIDQEKAFSAVVIHANASTLLRQAVAAGNSSYDLSGACQTIYVEARDQVAVGSHIVPELERFLTYVISTFAWSWVPEAMNSTNTPTTIPPQGASPAIGLTTINLRRFSPTTVNPGCHRRAHLPDHHRVFLFRLLSADALYTGVQSHQQHGAAMVSMVWDRLRQQLRPVLRPRMTWKYLLCVGLATYSVCWFLFASPVFSSNYLPPYTGPYSVGAIDLEIPTEPRVIHGARFKDSGHPAFQLETVLFTLYYPSSKGVTSSKPHHLWVPRPLGIVATGYARFARISNFVTNTILTWGMWAWVGGIKIPAQVDVPLHDSPVVRQSFDPFNYPVEIDDGFPVMVFSHGMASSRTQYTQYCGELASRGHVVAAIEHRDGSGPGSVIMQNNKKNRNLLHFSLGDVHPDSGLDSETFKQAQLDFRQAEVEATVRVLRHINEGRGGQVFSMNSRREGQDLHLWQGRLAMNNATVGGHSFGATLALQTLKNGPSNALPFQGAVVLDPGKRSGLLNHDVHVSTLIIHSNSWSSRHSIFFGRPHFDVVKDVVQGILKRGKDAWFLTSLGTSHPSVTDAPLIEPLLLSWTTGSAIDAHEGVNQYVKVSEKFLRYQSTGEKAGLLSECVTHPEYNAEDKNRTDSGPLPRKFWKYWQIHVAPPSCGSKELGD